MNYKITFKGAHKRDSYISYTNTVAQALMVLTTRAKLGYVGLITKVKG